MAKKMKGIRSCFECVNYNREHNSCYTLSEYKRGESFFECCPLPDVQEVKRAEWIATDGDDPGYESGHSAWIEFHCSACNYDMSLSPGEYGWGYNDEDKIPFNYCPHCGARMERKNG